MGILLVSMLIGGVWFHFTCLPSVSVLQVMPPEKLPGSPTVKEKSWSCPHPPGLRRLCTSSFFHLLSLFPAAANTTGPHTWPLQPRHLCHISHPSRFHWQLSVTTPARFFLHVLHLLQVLQALPPHLPTDTIHHLLAGGQATWLQEVMSQRQMFWSTYNR